MSRRRIRLNPCDYFFFGQHQLLARRCPDGNIAFMLLDLDGHIEPGLFREALARAIVLHPSTMGGFRISFPAGRPYWKVPRRIVEAARQAAAIAHQFHDLREAPDWRERIEQLHPGGRPPRWPHREGPQVRFEQYRLPDGRTRLFFRWPHYLMDADGAQWFLSEIGRQPMEDLVAGAQASLELPAALAPDDQRVDVLDGFSFLKRVGMVRRGLSQQQDHAGLKTRPLASMSPATDVAHGVVHRQWDSEQTRHLQDRAKQLAPAGPALYARYLAACVLRALDHVWKEAGVESDGYLISMPIRAGMSQRNAALFERRPVPGNYLVTPVLCGRRDRMPDKRGLGEDLLEQFQAFLRDRVDLTQWAMMWAASFLHKWSYPVIFKLPLDLVEFASGFSYYGEIAEPIRSLCGTRVLNLWGGGPTTSPPGLNPVFSKFEDRLNLSLTYDRHLVSDPLVHRFLALIEAEMFEPVDSAAARAGDA
jgi:hypothetical protein